jgi:signal transduction histidine kinase
MAAQQRHVEIAIQAPGALPFNGDQRLLRSAIENVLGNAVKFTHEGSAIGVRARRNDGTVTVEVEDGCGGLPQNNTTELFEPFVQRGENRTGFGLGLAIVKQAIEGHGGRVSVRNMPGKGCVFSLELPDAKDSN